MDVTSVVGNLPLPLVPSGDEVGEKRMTRDFCFWREVAAVESGLWHCVA